jgi:hypothetical protein
MDNIVKASTIAPNKVNARSVRVDIKFIISVLFCIFSGALLANIVYFNSVTAFHVGALPGAMFSNFVGLIVLLPVAWILNRKGREIENSVAVFLQRHKIEGALAAISSLSIVYFANKTSALTPPGLAIPLFITFVAILSSALELYKKTFSFYKGLYLCMILTVIISYLTSKEVSIISIPLEILFYAFMASFSLVLSRNFLKNISQKGSKIATCIFVRIIILVLSFYFLAGSFHEIQSMAVQDYRIFYAGLIGAVFQLSMLAAIHNASDLLANSFIQLSQIFFGWLTLSYE